MRRLHRGTTPARRLRRSSQESCHGEDVRTKGLLGLSSLPLSSALCGPKTLIFRLHFADLSCNFLRAILPLLNQKTNQCAKAPRRSVQPTTYSAINSRRSETRLAAQARPPTLHHFHFDSQRRPCAAASPWHYSCPPSAAVFAGVVPRGRRTHEGLVGIEFSSLIFRAMWSEDINISSPLR